jgi:hypothetical protein
VGDLAGIVFHANRVEIVQFSHYWRVKLVFSIYFREKMSEEFSLGE